MQLSENLKKEDSPLGAESRLLILGEIMQKFYRKSQIHWPITVWKFKYLAFRLLLVLFEENEWVMGILISYTIALV